MPATKSVLSFGLVAIPVALHTATQERDIGFRQLHQEDQNRIRYKKVCEGCGREVKADQIVKGYEFEKDRYVVVSDEELEQIKTEKEKSIQLLHFVDAAQIDSICYQRAYHVLPEAGGEKAFELLRLALLEEHRVAVGKTVLGTKETLLVLLPHADGLSMQTLYYANELKAVPKVYAAPGVASAELEMARQLVKSLNAPFELTAYRNEYQAKLQQMLEQKIAGKEIAAPKQPVSQDNIIDLMDALRRSVEQAEEGKTENAAKPAKRPRKKAA